MRDFVDFVRSDSPRNFSVLEGIAEARTVKEAAQELETAGGDFGRAHRQLRKLGRTFLTRKARPQLRRAIAERRTRQSSACTAVTQPHVLSSLSWNRIELYNEVWNQPLVKLSRTYGISDVRLGKVCRKLHIPHPGRGYWGKRKAGIDVERLPLPEFKDAPVVRRMTTKNGAERFGQGFGAWAAGPEYADHKGNGRARDIGIIGSGPPKAILRKSLRKQFLRNRLGIRVSSYRAHC